MMENLPTRVPHVLFSELESAFIPSGTPADAFLELVITIESEDIPARDFAAYLALVDRLYGRLRPEGLRSYSHRDWGRLRIAEIHKSDLEIIFRFFRGHEHAATVIVILFFLKSLPNMFKVTAEGIKLLAEAYKNYEESRSIRDDRIRKELLENTHGSEQALEIRQSEIQLENAAEQLGKTRRRQFARLLNALIMEEESNLPAPVRFARRQVRNVILRIR